MPIRHVLIASALGVVLALQAGWFAATTSGTYDETTYQGFGRNFYQLHDAEPMTGWGVAPLPVVLTQAAPALDGFAPYPRAIALARTSAILLFGIPLVILTYWMLFHAFGATAAVVGTVLLVLSPSIIAYSALATTDVCFMTAALAGVAALIHHLERRSISSLMLLGAALSVALAAKYSALALFPVAGIASFAIPADTHQSILRRAAGSTALTVALLLVAVAFAWSLYLFQWVPYGLPPMEDRLMPASIVAIARQLHHQSLAEPGFLLGMRSNSGWWYYLPAALAMKSTPAELVLLAGAIAGLARGWKALTPSALVWRLTFLVFLAAGIANHIPFGIRYVLILLPLAIFLTSDWWFQATGGVWRYAAPGVLLVLQMWSAATIAPYYLGYFNVFAGGPEKGYMRLADSNVDWGQDLPALKSALRRLGAKRALLSYFGTAPVDAYGVHADAWDGSVRDGFERWDWVAISATNLDGVFLKSDPFEDFRGLDPSARAGYSILLYSTQREDVRRAMRTAAERMQ